MNDFGYLSDSKTTNVDFDATLSGKNMHNGPYLLSVKHLEYL